MNIFWFLPGGGPFGGGYILDDGGWGWMVVGGGGYILADGGW